MHDREFDDARLFAFEMDFAGTLHCIPMSVRLKLDLCGTKLSLRQWNRFSREERSMLLFRPCSSPADIQFYREDLAQLILTRARETPTDLPIDPRPHWNDLSRVPERLTDYAKGLGLRAPSLSDWQALSALQRFALFKLSRPGHDNDNFLPAMREFGLAP